MIFVISGLDGAMNLQFFKLRVTRSRRGPIPMLFTSLDFKEITSNIFEDSAISFDFRNHCSGRHLSFAAPNLICNLSDQGQFLLHVFNCDSVANKMARKTTLRAYS
jgi:hypothetical protein